MFIQTKKSWDDVTLVVNAHVDSEGYVIPSDGVSQGIRFKNFGTVASIYTQCHFIKNDTGPVSLNVDDRTLTFPRDMANTLFDIIDRLYWEYQEANNPEIAELMRIDREAS